MSASSSSSLVKLGRCAAVAKLGRCARLLATVRDERLLEQLPRTRQVTLQEVLPSNPPLERPALGGERGCDLGDLERLAV